MKICWFTSDMMLKSNKTFSMKGDDDEEEEVEAKGVKTFIFSTQSLQFISFDTLELFELSFIT